MMCTREIKLFSPSPLFQQQDIPRDKERQRERKRDKEKKRQRRKKIEMRICVFFTGIAVKIQSGGVAKRWARFARLKAFLSWYQTQKFFTGITVKIQSGV